MHEAGIAQGVLDAAVAALSQHQQEAGATETATRKMKIVKIVVSAGVLSGIEKECLSMYLTELSRGTAAEGAELELRIQPAHLICRECGHSFAYDGSGPVEIECPKCKGPLRLEGGRDEIILENLEATSDD